MIRLFLTVRKELKEAVETALGIELSGDAKLAPEQLETALQAAYEAGVKMQEDADRYRDHFFQQLMQMLPDYVYFKDLQSRFIIVNPAQARHLGLETPEEAIGKSDFDFFRKEFAQAKYDAEQEIIRTGVGFLFQEEHHFLESGEEQWDLSTKLPLYDLEGKISGIFGLSRNITDKKLSELELENQKALLETIVEILPCRVFVRDLEGRFLLINQEYRKWIQVSRQEKIEGKYLEEVVEDEKIRRIKQEDLSIIKSGKSIKNQIMFDESPLQRGRWVLASKVPLRTSDGGIQGMVGMTLDVTEQKQAEERARVAQSALLQKNEQMEEELNVARQLQERLLSEGFQADNSFSMSGTHWKIDAHYLYQPSHHLAGDFFFLLPLGVDQLGVIICDVMGHGVKAALVTTLIRGLLLEIPGSLENPSTVLSFLNRKLFGLAHNTEFPRFVTAAYGVVDLESGQLSMANAGHHVPLWRHQSESDEMVTETLPLETTGNALGLMDSSQYSNTVLTLNSATGLYFYTDGIIEMENREGEAFGLRRLVSGLQNKETMEPGRLTEAVSRSISTFSEGREFEDDLCLVSLAITPREDS